MTASEYYHQRVNFHDDNFQNVVDVHLNAILDTVEEEHVIQTNLFVYTRLHLQNIYIPSNSQETSLQTYTCLFSLEVKMVEILMDLNWK